MQPTSREERLAIINKRTAVKRGRASEDKSVYDTDGADELVRALGLEVEPLEGDSCRVRFPATGSAVADEAGACLLARHTIMELRLAHGCGIPCVLWADDARMRTMLCPIGDTCREITRDLLRRMEAYARERWGTGATVAARPVGDTDGNSDAIEDERPVEVVEEVPLDAYGIL